MGLDACGAAAAAASIDAYRAQGLERIPFRGGMAANTVAGTVSGWDAAYAWSRAELRGRLPVARLLEDAIFYARDGIPVTRSLSDCIAAKRGEMTALDSFAQAFLPGGEVPAVGSRFRQPRLAATLEQLARKGLDDFYQGELARSLARSLADAGSPVALADLQAHKAAWKTPLALARTRWARSTTCRRHAGPGRSLLILGQLDRLLGSGTNPSGMDPLGAPFVHACVEATKQAFAIRDRDITDPAYMTVDPQACLDPARLDEMAERIRPGMAAAWGGGQAPATRSGWA